MFEEHVRRYMHGNSTWNFSLPRSFLCLRSAAELGFLPRIGKTTLGRRNHYVKTCTFYLQYVYITVSTSVALSAVRGWNVLSRVFTMVWVCICADLSNVNEIAQSRSKYMVCLCSKYATIKGYVLSMTGLMF